MSIDSRSLKVVLSSVSQGRPDVVVGLNSVFYCYCYVIIQTLTTSWTASLTLAPGVPGSGGGWPSG